MNRVKIAGCNRLDIRMLLVSLEEALSAAQQKNTGNIPQPFSIFAALDWGAENYGLLPAGVCNWGSYRSSTTCNSGHSAPIWDFSSEASAPRWAETDR